MGMYRFLPRMVTLGSEFFLLYIISSLQRDIKSLPRIFVLLTSFTCNGDCVLRKYSSDLWNTRHDQAQKKSRYMRFCARCKYFVQHVTAGTLRKFEREYFFVISIHLSAMREIDLRALDGMCTNKFKARVEAERTSSRGSNRESSCSRNKSDVARSRLLALRVIQSLLYRIRSKLLITSMRLISTHDLTNVIVSEMDRCDQYLGPCRAILRNFIVPF